MYKFNVQFRFPDGERKDVYLDECLSLWNIRQWFHLLTIFIREFENGTFPSLIITLNTKF